VNEEVVHASLGEEDVEGGDIVGLDFGWYLRDTMGDAAVTVP